MLEKKIKIHIIIGIFKKKKILFLQENMLIIFIKYLLILFKH